MPEAASPPPDAVPQKPPARSGLSFGCLLGLAVLIAGGACCLSPFALLTYQRHGLDRFCGSIVKGEPIDLVAQRARDQGFGVYETADRSPELKGSLMVSTDFLLAHLLCNVDHEGSRVTSAWRNELW